MIRSLIACCALGLAFLVAPPAQAQAAPQPGECYSRADVDKDYLDLQSKVDCSEPHAVQVTHVGKLPGFLRNRSKVALGSTKSALYGDYVRAGYRICAAGNTAKGIWPERGKAVAAALGKNTINFYPSSNPPLSPGFVLPDQTAWDAGVRSLVCIVYNPSAPQAWVGNLQALESADPLPDFRLCLNRVGEPQSCGAPHSAEELFVWEVTGFPKGKSVSSEQYAPYDARCQAAANVLIGAQRADLSARTFLLGRGKDPYLGKDIAALSCYVDRVDEMDLPPGTVVGLGDRPLGS